MADHSSSPRWDGEISVRAVLLASVGLLVLGVLAAVSMYFLQVGTQDGLVARDPSPRPVPTVAADPRVGPRLQMNPDIDLVAMHQRESQIATSWGWVDESQGIVRMPVDEALVWVAEKGIEAATQAVSTTPAAPVDAAAADGELVFEEATP
jgi:hypothetical protein